jgi:hypothetical protein
MERGRHDDRSRFRQTQCGVMMLMCVDFIATEASECEKSMMRCSCCHFFAADESELGLRHDDKTHTDHVTDRGTDRSHAIASLMQ